MKTAHFEAPDFWTKPYGENRMWETQIVFEFFAVMFNYVHLNSSEKS